MTDCSQLHIRIGNSFSQERHGRRLVLLPLLRICLVSQAVGGIGPNGDNPLVIARIDIVDLGLYRDMLFDDPVIGIAAEFELWISPKVRDVLDLVTMRGEKLVDLAKLCLIEMVPASLVRRPHKTEAA